MSLDGNGSKDASSVALPPRPTAKPVLVRGCRGAPDGGGLLVVDIQGSTDELVPSPFPVLTGQVSSLPSY